MGVQRVSTQWSCSRFQAEGTTYFVSVAAHPAAEGAAEGSADVAVTDGGRAWVATGLTSQRLTGVQPHDRSRLAHLLAAVSELEEATLPYSRSAKVEADGGLTLSVDWQPPGQEVRVRLRASLAAAPAPAPLVADLLALALDNVAALAAAAQQAQQVASEFEKQAARSQRLVDEYVSQQEAQQREVHAKMAALLNSKKRRLRELEAELEEARAETARLRGAGAAMDVDPGEAAGGPGGAGGGAQPRRVHNVVDSDDEEEEGGEGASDAPQSPVRDDSY